MTFAASASHLLLAAGLSAAMFAVGLARRRACWSWRVGGGFGAAMTGYVADAELRGYRNDVSTPTLVLAIAAGLIVATGLIAVGLRGRRVGDHPYCRRCGFDLFGRPVDATACAECGTDLFAKGAIVVGVRRRRAAPLLAGLFALLLSIAGTATFARDALGWAERYDWRKRWPESWLVADLRGTDPDARGAAYAELLRNRLWHGTIGEKGSSALIDEAFRRGPGLWMDGFAPSAAARLARDRWIAGTIDEATVRRAMRATINLRLEVAPTAAAGHVLRYRIVSPDPTLALAPSIAFANRVDALDGRPLPAATTSTLDPGTGIAALGDNFALVDDLAIGPATLTTKLTVTATLAAPGRPTLVETRDLAFRASPRIVEPAFRTCLPGRVRATDRGEWGSFAPMADELRATLVRRGRGGTFAIDNQSDLPILADARLVSGDASRPLGPVFLHADRVVRLDVDDVPAGQYALVFDPAPELGTELYQLVPTCGTLTRIPSSAIRVEDALGTSGRPAENGR